MSNTKHPQSTFRLGCDIGGTFTDFVLLNETTGELFLEKTLTTPRDPIEGVLHGVRKLATRVPGFMSRTTQFIHGTTLAVNAIVERKGARTALITTRGFRDLLEIRRATRAHLFDMESNPPQVLVPRHLRREINERIWSDGRILEPLDEIEVIGLATELDAAGVESIAVVMIHAYQSPQHERKVDQILKTQTPHIFVSLSSDVLPLIHEYERASTTTVNAYVKPLMKDYLSRLKKGLADEELSGVVHVMLSGGGVTSTETASEFPVRIIESGPVGGVLAANHFGSLAGYDTILAFDMGGTTAKSSLIDGGELPITSDYEVDRTHRFMPGSGLPLGVPSVDVVEIGAGGGSIARVDSLGLLKVGPDSAGAEPGPACYGLGGDHPTVSDANLILGYLAVDSFLGGEMSLDMQAAEDAIRTHIADPLNVSLVEAAWGIHNLVNENMATTLRLHAAQRGGKLSRAVLMAYGGAGPLHCYHLARRLGIRQVLVPPGAGVVSALGFLTAPLSYEVANTMKQPLARADLPGIEERYQRMEEVCQKALGTVGGDLTLKRWVEMCYRGQGYEIRLPVTEQDFAGPAKESLWEKFQEAYRRRYGYAYDDLETEITNLRVMATANAPDVSWNRVGGTASAAEAHVGERLAYSEVSGDFLVYPVYDRYRLAPGIRIEGPAIIQERESTTVVGSNTQVGIDDRGILILTLRSDHP